MASLSTALGAASLVAQSIGAINPFSFSNNVYLSNCQRSYNWDVLFISSMGVFPGALLGKFCQGIKFGDYNIGSIGQMKVGAYQEFFAGLPEINTVSMSFIKPAVEVGVLSGDPVSQYFLEWRRLIVDNYGNYRPKNGYARNVYVYMAHTTYLPSDIFVLRNAFPISSPQYDLNYEASDVVKFNIEFRIDRIESLNALNTLGTMLKQGVHAGLSLVKNIF
jgi:hypothetical protein